MKPKSNHSILQSSDSDCARETNGGGAAEGCARRVELTPAGGVVSETCSKNGRIILQDVASRHFLSSEGTWVSSCQQARVFEHTYLALLEGLKHPELVVQIVWCFRDPSRNYYLPVRASDSDRIVPCTTCPFVAGREPKEEHGSQGRNLGEK